jgi:hypothetical protein
MLAKKDSDEIVRGSAFNIASWAKKSEREVLDALKILSSPDTKRLEPQPFEGRRIEKVEEGWRLLNGEKYQKEMQRINARRRKTEQQAQYRLEQNQMENAAANGDPPPASIPGGRSVFAKPAVLDVKACMMERGLSQEQAQDLAERFVAHYDSNGWKIGGRAPMKSWPAAVTTWTKNHADNGGNDSKSKRNETPAQTAARLTVEANA